MNVSKQVKKEKEEYQQRVIEESEATNKKLEKKENMLPVTSTGLESVDNMMKAYYDEETLKHIQISEEKVKILARELRKFSSNMSRYSIPMICKATKCPMASRCPLLKAGIAPLGHSCPIEMMLIDQSEMAYMDDLGIDKQSKIEMDLVHDMIEADIMDWRTSQNISEHGLFDWNTIGVSERGEPIVKKEEAIAIGIKLKFKARKDKLREDLMATRKMRAKFGLDKRLDPSQFASDLNAKYKEAMAASDADFEDAPEQAKMDDKLDGDN